MISRSAVLVLCIVGAGFACVQNAKRGEGVLPRPPANAQLRGDSVVNAFAPLQQGAFMRVLHRTADAPTFTVETRELEVAPRATTNQLTLPGGALIEVRGGAGRLMSANANIPLVLGTVASVADGERFTLTSEGMDPLSLRVYVVTSK